MPKTGKIRITRAHRKMAGAEKHTRKYRSPGWLATSEGGICVACAPLFARMR
jgi:hypothetical protein